MQKRLLFGTGIVLLAALVTLVIWQGSFTFGRWAPVSPQQTFIFWAVSTLIFLLTVTLGFMLFRAVLKLYIERQRGQVGSRIKTKLVAGALALTVTPVVFLVLWSISILNRNLDKWFTRPAETIKYDLQQVSGAFRDVTEARALALANWLAALPETKSYLATGNRPSREFERFCAQNGVDYAVIRKSDAAPLPVCGSDVEAEPGRKTVAATIALEGGANLLIRTQMPIELAAKQRQIDASIAEYDQLAVSRRDIRRSYLLLLVLITLFILFVATWVAQFLARQISEPITALLAGAEEVRGGNLGYRVHARAIDELATLVRSFNEMTQALDSNAKELERRRRFNETILESIPTGVISVTGDGRIQKVNSALSRIFPDAARATRIDDLFNKEDAGEIRYLMKRARRTGLAVSRQFELKNGGQTVHLSATVAALEERVTSGFVLVLEDASELLRAQKAAAWHEVARRIAHEIKNPLTPISLCAERIGRQLERGPLQPEGTRILRECASTISREVESVKTLVDEFSQFARFPAAQPAPSDLNEVIEKAVEIFTGRLSGIDVHKELASGLPRVNIDREQFKRVVINLVDNAAEAMQESLVKRIWISTAAPTSDTVELIIADTGCGVSAEDKEKLFLPYFSTKGRGTGLGLAIVAHILADHNAQIRVEDNPPAGARFIVEIPALAARESEARPAETRA